MSFRADKLLRELNELASIRSDEAELLDVALQLHCPVLKNLSLHIGAKAALLLILGFGGKQVEIPTVEEFQRLVEVLEVAKEVRAGKHLGWLKTKHGKATVEAAISLLETSDSVLREREQLLT